MAKRHKKRRTQRPSKRPSPKMTREVAAAMDAFSEGDTATARRMLLDLAARYPRSKAVLYALLEVCQATQDWRTVALYSEQLLPLERGLEQADTLNNLIYAYIQLGYPALAWQYASELIAKHPDFEQRAQVQSLLETIEPMLLEQIQERLGATAFTREEKLELHMLHDRVQFLTESGRAQDSIRAAEPLLAKVPDMLPVLNNVSLAQFMQGDIDQAIVTAQNVVARDADNFHALGNLVRYHFLSAQFDQAQVYALQLQKIDSDNPDLEVKQAEAFAFLGDDDSVWAAYEQAVAKAVPENPLLLHLAAVASYRLGDERTAWKLWEKAANQQPGFSMAHNSLADKHLPIGERNVPWYWPFGYWFPQDFRQLLERHFGENVQRMSSKEVEQAAAALLAERPYLTQLFPHILERGDRTAREFVLNMIRMVETPELLQQMYLFAQSPHGSDDLRMEAMQFISQHHPLLLPEDKIVPMWVDGRQTDLFMLGFEITDEPDPIEGLSAAALEKHGAAYELLMQDRAAEAETLLLEVIAVEPDFCSAYNHLAVAYEMQGRSEEARALTEEIHARFPDYFFARVALARINAHEKRIEAARELLKPLLLQPKLHISEFRALASAQIDIALADNQIEAARTWLDMWQQMDEDNPELVEWKLRIEGPRQWRTILSKLIDQDPE